MDELEVSLATFGILIFFCSIPLLCICCHRESREYDLIPKN